MEIPLVAEALRIPGLAPRLLSDLAGAWASVALLVAGLAAFYGFLLARAKLALLRFRRSASAISLHSNFSYSGDDDEDDVESSESLSDEEEEEEEEDAPPSSPSDDSARRGLRWDGGILDLPLGGAVVRTWEGLGLGFDRAGSGLISLVDLNRGEVLRSFLAHVPAAAASLASPAVVLSAAQGAAAAAVRVWDARASGEQIPAASAEWRTTRRRRVVGVSGGEGRIYVGDDDGVVTAADLRRGGSPLVVETWRGHILPLLPSPK
ncbi:LOW QUALITY PROTEIN: uncharacterized protein LOC141836594 [Curcuma longa]|uniref:LOW QUALITY PROTEIN: uncharacterized protein LOC141836594 n=1 Tax=Curcuma longa TaxID=136217 RepID=UPI003D9F2AAD